MQTLKSALQTGRERGGETESTYRPGRKALLGENLYNFLVMQRFLTSSADFQGRKKEGHQMEGGEVSNNSGSPASIAIQ